MVDDLLKGQKMVQKVLVHMLHMVNKKVRWYFKIFLQILFLESFLYRHGTHVFVNWLKLDPLFMIFGHFCNNKEEIKNMGDSTSLR